MGIRQYKPTSAGRRGGAVSDFAECTHPKVNRPEKSLLKRLKKKGGRNNQGVICVRFRGGGTTKGPKPRDYSYSLPKKALRIATRMAVLAKLQDQEVVLVDDLAFDAPKTKEMAGVLKALKLGAMTCLIGTAGLQPTVYKSARNIRGVEILPAAEFNAYCVLRPKRLLLTKAALQQLRDKGKT